MRAAGGRVRLDAFELRATAFSARTSIKVERMKIGKARKPGVESEGAAVTATRDGADSGSSGPGLDPDSETPLVSCRFWWRCRIRIGKQVLYFQ